ncbi:ankyrin [Fomitopsis betulina]|nr:ankyrin [Fomitopsis betulina]
MTTYTLSPTFENAAAYLSNASSLSSVSNAIKLELYGLYKYLTASRAPNISRPSIFDMTGRAKWDAWSAASKTYGDRVEDAEARYIAIAESLGWAEGKIPEDEDENELDLDSSDDEGHTSRNDGGGASGLGASVSMMRTSREETGSVLSDLAIAGDTQGLRTFLGAHPEVDVNAKDENGYTPLHLACDRGHAAVLRLLLENGADTSIKVITILTELCIRPDSA